MSNARIIVLLVFGTLASPAISAQENHWEGSCATFQFGNPACWESGVVPGAADYAVFDLDSATPYTVTFSADSATKKALVRTDKVDWDLGGYKFSLQGSTYVNELNLTVGQDAGDNGELTIRNGVVDAWNTGIGLNAGSTGSLILRDGGTIDAGTVSNKVFVGRSGTGNLLVMDGGLVDAGRIYVGHDAGSLGSAIFEGEGRRALTFEITVGLHGQGSFLARNGADIWASRFIVAGQPGSEGTAIFEGAGTELQGGSSITVGQNGIGSLTLRDGAVANNVGTVTIGDYANSTGVLTVDGTDTQLTLTGSRNILVGEWGDGQLLITNGGYVRSSYFSTLGDRAGSSGTVAIDGAGSRWDSWRVVVGDEGTGSLTVSDGALLSGESVFAGTTADSSGDLTVTGTGSSMQLSNGVYVGHNGTGTMLISDGATVSSDGGSAIGSGNHGGNGTATVTGPGTSFLVGGSLVVGGGFITGDGVGSLTVENGAALITNIAEIAGSQYSGGTAVTVTGAGSSWIVNDSLYVGGNQSGSKGAAMVNIQGGATVTVANTLKSYSTVFLADSTLDVGALDSTGYFGVIGGTINAQSIEVAGLGLGNFVVAGHGGSEVVASNITGDFNNRSKVQVRSNATANFNSNFVNNGIVDIESGSTAVFAGTLSGSGDFTGLGDAIINGVLAPGNSPGLMAFEGDLEFGSSSLFQAELAGELLGVEYDSISVGGTATLDGTLEVLFIDGYSAAHGDFFDVLVADTIVGEFEITILPDLGIAGWYWEAEYMLDSAGVDRLRLTAVPVPPAVWLFASGLGLLGCFRRRQTA